jgi:hypothetical protein
MKKITALSLLAAVLIVTPALADSSPSSVASDANAIVKDDTALGKDNAILAKDRATKAHDKATGNWAGQAVDSVSLGADHVQRSEKEGEKSVDKNIMNSDTNN